MAYVSPTMRVAVGDRGRRSRQQAINELNAEAQRLGVTLNEHHLNEAAKAASYSGTGDVDDTQMERARAYVRQLKTPQNQNPNTAPAPAPAPKPAPKPAPAALPPHMIAANPQFTQFTRTADPFAVDVNALVDNILANPETLGPQQVGQMKAAAKESALSRAEQLKGARRNDLIGRGFSAEGGTFAGAEALGDMELVDELLRNERDIDLAAAATNREDVLRAIQLADSLVAGRTGRNIAEYGAELQGETTQAGFDFDIDKFLEDQRRFDSDYGLRKHGLDTEGILADRGMTLQELLGEEGIKLDRDRLDENKREFDTATKLDLVRFLESTRQFDNTLGENKRQFNNSSAFNWANLSANQQGRLLDYLVGLFG